MKNTWSQEEFIDIRSDTTTQPTETMKVAMNSAVVGDDTLGDDPTVKELENLAAEITGKEAALFCPSGMMANFLGLRSLTKPGDYILCPANPHVYGSGLLGAASLTPRFLPEENGVPILENIESLQRGTGSSVFLLENTYNARGGNVLSPQYMEEAGILASKMGLPIYVDGARVFNAAVAQKVAVNELLDQAHMAMFCLSKGLSAPVGSLLLGPFKLISDARRMRHLFGGSMRQAGILASAGLIALEEMVERLSDDHANAKRLAVGLTKLNQVKLLGEVGDFKTNIVFFQAVPPLTNGVLVEKLEKKNILVLELSNRIRAVTHRHISENDIETVLKEIAKL